MIFGHKVRLGQVCSICRSSIQLYVTPKRISTVVSTYVNLSKHGQNIFWYQEGKSTQTWARLRVLKNAHQL